MQQQLRLVVLECNAKNQQFKTTNADWLFLGGMLQQVYGD